MLRACGALVLDRQLPVGRASAAFAADGSLADPAAGETLGGIVCDLVALAARPHDNLLAVA